MFRSSSIGGTQSPPLEDCQPMGACSIEGGNVGGIPDRQQRSQYFDSSDQQHAQTQTDVKPVVVEPQSGNTTSGVGQQTHSDRPQSGQDVPPALEISFLHACEIMRAQITLIDRPQCVGSIQKIKERRQVQAHCAPELHLPFDAYLCFRLGPL
ncbi:hypothetical protein BJV74DRAFT_822180 [Russula compacta]|nr:hypothetical protein BJV74DRAFT_822180 [Russula compacta]